MDFYNRLSDEEQRAALCFLAVRETLTTQAAEPDGELARWVFDERSDLHGRWAYEMSSIVGAMLAPALDRTRHAAELVAEASKVVQDWVWEHANKAETDGEAVLSGTDIPCWGEIEAAYSTAAELDDDGLPRALSDVLTHELWPDGESEKVRQARIDAGTNSTPERGVPTLSPEGGAWRWLGAPYIFDGSSTLPSLFILLSWHLWDLRWRDEAWKSRKRSQMVASLTARTIQSTVGLMSPATIVEKREDQMVFVSPDGERHGAIDFDDVRNLLTGTTGGAVEPRVVQATARELVRARRSIAGIHTFMHGVHTVTELVKRGADLRQSWPRWVEWAQTVADYAEIKLTPSLKKDLYLAAWFGNTAQIDLFDGRTQRGLWTLRAPDPFKRGRRKKSQSEVVTITYDDILSPGWATRENQSDRNRGVKLVWLPHRLPVAQSIGSHEKAPAQLYALLMLAHIASKTKASRVAYGADLPMEERERMAKLAGLSLACEQRQLFAMVDAGLLSNVSNDRFALAGEDAIRLASYKNHRSIRRSRKGSSQSGKR